MTLTLSGPGLQRLSALFSEDPFVARVATRVEGSDRSREVLLVDEYPAGAPEGYRAVLVRGRAEDRAYPPDTFRLDPRYAYLNAGDVVRLDPARRGIAVLYRRSSRFNSLLVTERCDNYCLMCSQPPRDIDDRRIVDELLEAIPLMDPETEEIGITGGEPGLLGSRLTELVEALKRSLPRAAVHILSNGRAFAHCGLAAELGALRHPDLMVGVPLYSALPEDHDFVVQARGAYDETIRGILNLKRHQVRVELRFVLHRETHAGLRMFAEFVRRNLLFVDHVALMGLELMGFARANLEQLWIDPLDYANDLCAAVGVLDGAGIPTSIYNHPLCTLPAELHRFARQSISDWKNEYIAECEGCTKRESCAGFFSSSKLRRSRGIARFTLVSAEPEARGG